jgi:hypothetical protein
MVKQFKVREISEQEGPVYELRAGDAHKLLAGSTRGADFLTETLLAAEMDSPLFSNTYSKEHKLIQ